MTTEHNRRSTDLLALEITKRGFIIERQEKRIAELELYLNKVAEAYIDLSNMDMGRYCEIPIDEWDSFASLMWDSPMIGEILRNKNTPPATPKGE